MAKLGLARPPQTGESEMDALISKRTLRKIESLRNRIAKSRDALRELVSELEDIEAGADEAVEALDHAADAMSRML